MVLARLADSGAVNQSPMEMVAVEQNMIVDGGIAHLVDNDSVSRIRNMLEGLLAPAKQKDMGRPATNMKKAPYEVLSKRTRFCIICRKQGHKRTTCPDPGDVPKQPSKPAKCKNYGVEGHRRNHCNKAMELRLAPGTWQMECRS